MTALDVVARPIGLVTGPLAIVIGLPQRMGDAGATMPR
jgi:hypothetical protein